MTGFSPLSVDDIAVNTIRTLAADVVGKANSGHPVSKHRRPLLNSLAASPLPTIQVAFSDAPILDFRVPQWEWLRRPTSCSQGASSTRHSVDHPLPCRALTNRVLRSGFSTPIPKALNGSTGTVSFCRTGELSAFLCLSIYGLIVDLNSHG